MSHRPAASSLLAAALLLPALSARAETTPERGQRPSHLFTVGRAFTVEAIGCESRGKRFIVTAVQLIDRSKIDEDEVVSGVFLRKRELTGRSGWRNVCYSPDGRSVEVELFAEGAGEWIPAVDANRSKCQSPSLSRVVVDVEAWVFD